MKILFITRKYPPSTGGMENMAVNLYGELIRHEEVALIKWGGDNKWLPLIYPWLFLRACGKLMFGKYDTIYLQDGLMAPIGVVLRFLFKTKTVVTIHGLEVTYKNTFYRKIILPCIKRQGKIIAVSEESKAAVIESLGDIAVEVINNGVEDKFYSSKPRKQQLDVIATATGMHVANLEKSLIVHSGGRLVKRKGVAWFIDAVLPELVKKMNRDVVYFVSGTGPDLDNVREAVKRHGLQEVVHMLGRINDDVLHALYNCADIYVMPNIPVPGDMEGFGLVALEAASAERIVIASKLEGIQDAITDGKNGILVQPKDASCYIDTIINVCTDTTKHQFGVAARSYTIKKFSWEAVAKQYIASMKSMVE